MKMLRTIEECRVLVLQLSVGLLSTYIVTVTIIVAELQQPPPLQREQVKHDSHPADRISKKTACVIVREVTAIVA